ncbi:AAA family ATPase [Pseudobacteriovorax antillogorgiicola]|uniref:MoxR-like ATPase n=1 Tax=Pseudobacteriovorax antillogorgiicola TaxID=1513793 RepID=A0A1Y6BTK2_9BACT|nr:MoxR family ATPase [Pseudobacteriovorax antillogorgiicola]TCS53910.1 MoxR-like ATPase [Pseudobacteriovorax antillogorgiicola]SMF20660.1 MoxR-like ATPase [Pseudobacteriovorax antillogorgiicola]
MDRDIEEQIVQEGTTLKQVVTMMGRRLVGQSHVAERLLMGLLCDGHVLLEGLPGLAKTTAVKALGDSSDLAVKRIQFTPDLLPADVIGTQIYDPKEGQFQVKKGPVFCNLLIADEINRAPAKVQSALLEAMQEKQVTLGDETYRLDKPFLVMATQNPIEQEGTYPLPEAQVDRFLFKVKVGYGSMDEEQEIMRRMASGVEIDLEETITASDILRMRELVNRIYVSDQVRQYIVQLVFATRDPGGQGIYDLKGMIHVGASPRASINLEKAARAQALMEGRSYVTPQDVKDVGPDILRHRIMPTYEAEAENVTSEDLVAKLFERVDVP